MSLDIEQTLRDSGLRYTKEVDPQSGETYSLTFESSQGLIPVRVRADEFAVHAWCFLRDLDTLSVRASRKDVYLELLKLSGVSQFARVFVWTSTPDERDWLGVSASVPGDTVSPHNATQAIVDTVSLAERVLQVLATLSPLPQEQFSPTP